MSLGEKSRSLASAAKLKTTPKLPAIWYYIDRMASVLPTTPLPLLSLICHYRELVLTSTSYKW
jgi:hypothetical protein